MQTNWHKFIARIYHAFLSLQQVLSYHSNCPNAPYRTFDGTCNNLQNPSWGAANTLFARLIPAKYSDGKSQPPLAKDGSELPSARLLSVEVFEEGVQNSPEFSLLNMQFGQIVAHDMALTRGVRDQVPCCANGRLQPNRGSDCFAILCLPRILCFLFEE
uniref:Heme peroxidase 1 n=1 Tax=Anopheles epiroticus TaxID=199890 RepID=A0A182PUT0_9DIPT